MSNWLLMRIMGHKPLVVERRVGQRERERERERGRERERAWSLNIVCDSTKVTVCNTRYFYFTVHETVSWEQKHDITEYTVLVGNLQKTVGAAT